MAVGENTKYGKILAEWQVPEYIKHDRSRSWYYVMGTIAALLVIQALATYNFLFAIIILIASSIVYLQDRGEPEMLDFLIVQQGVVLGKRFYSFKDIRSFWVIYEPPDVKILYLGINGVFRKELAIHLENENPVEIRRLLLNYLREDLAKENEAGEENLSRTLKL